jgi:hypothetical protein
VSTAFVMQAEVLVQAVARVPGTFMVQTEAVGPLVENRVAAGSCGISQSFGRGSCGRSIEAAGSSEESWGAACVMFLVRDLTWLSSARNSMSSVLDVGDLEKVPLVFMSMYLCCAMITSSPGMSVKLPS